MKPLRNSRALMVELMIIIVFFSLSSVIIVQLFAAANHISRESSVSTSLLQSAQSWADRIQAEDDISAFLTGNGWTYQEDGYFFSLAADGGELRVSDIRETQGISGRLVACEVTAYIGEDSIFSLPVARYRGEGAP